MGENRENQELDWELSGDYYKANEHSRELKLEDFIGEDAAEPGAADDMTGMTAELQRVAADVRRVMELSLQGKTVAEIADLTGAEPKYVSDIQVCVQSFPEDNEIAVAHLILMG